MRAQHPASPLGWLSRGLYGDQPAVDAISGAQPRLGTLKETLEPIVNQALDTINPIPISAAGTIIGPKAARDWSEELVGKAKKAWESGKYTTKSGEKSKVALTQDYGYYPSRGKGDWRTQIDDDTAELKSGLVNNMRTYISSKKKTGDEFVLSDVWKHTNLYENYPTIATRTRVKFTRLPGLALGQVDTKLDKAGDLLESVMEIDPYNVMRYAKREGISLSDMYHQIFTHEGQHIVQAIEGMPSGSNPGYFTRMKDPNAMEPDSYRMLKALLKQMPPEAPRAKQIKEHLDFLDRVQDVPDGVLYRHTLGEADAGWAEKMHKVKNVKYQTPLHEREVGKQWWGGKQEPYNPEWSALTSRQDSIMGSVQQID